MSKTLSSDFISQSTYGAPREALEAHLQNDSFRLLRDFRRDTETVFADVSLKPLEAFALDLSAYGSPHPKDLASSVSVFEGVP